MEIRSDEIATNRYAPDADRAINLYSTGAAEGLTLGQLVAAVCVRTAGALEEQSVNKMNRMNACTEKLEKASECMRRIAEDRMSDWTAEREYLEGEVGVVGLPDGLDSHEKRMQAVDAVKKKLEILTRQAQEDMIDMQTLISRRDMTFNTSSNIVRTMGNSKMNAAGRMI
ncbi:MAG: hypothetical protein IKC80_06380 [Kiritimatiellae bacterium]|nr:hypothetical protein [Kiritimatiellia bacterium]